MTGIISRLKVKFRHFSDKDNFGGITNMDNIFLGLLDTARHVIRQSAIVHCGYDKSGGHVSTSRHYALPCDATDLHYSKEIKDYRIESGDISILHRTLDKIIFSKNARTILDFMIIQRLSGIKRVGIYPFGIPRTYFHLDNTAKNKIDFWIGLQVDGIFDKLKKILPEFANEFDALLNKINKVNKDKAIVYIYPK